MIQFPVLFPHISLTTYDWAPIQQWAPPIIDGR